jgi:1,2-dihydroxy-3-keto-5-methylthiopentene dioxygenase
MKAYWLEPQSDQQTAISAEKLVENGVYYARLATKQVLYQSPLDELKQQRGYNEQDVVALDPSTPNLDGICAKFADEHHHDEDEVRFVIRGEGIFDIRSPEDRWMRVVVEPGDLIVVPKDRHHRFMLTDAKTIECVRLFQNASGWTPHYREHPAATSVASSAGSPAYSR